MTIDYESIKRSVRVLLDENEDMQPLLDGSEGMDNDAMQTDQITEEMILQAVDRVHNMAPAEMLTDVTEEAAVTWSQFELAQRCTLPQDMLRLTYVKLDGWLKGVSDFVPEGTALYSTMFSRFMAVRPTVAHPMVGVAHGVGNGLEIVAAPVVRTAGETAGTGAEGPTADAAGTVTGTVRYVKMAHHGGKIADRCNMAMQWMVANLYYSITGNSDMATMAAREVAEELGISPKTE